MKKIFLTILILTAFANVFPQSQKSFESQNKRNRYSAFSFGMGAYYSNNKSLVTFAGYELPNYPYIPESEKFGELQPGFDFFGGYEKQIHKNFSLKLGYNFNLKSLKTDRYPNAYFDYNNHMLMLTAYYVIPLEYAFFKIGAGAGGLLSNFSFNTGIRTGDYTSKGIAAKLDAIMDIQVGKTMAIFLNGYLMNTFNSKLKDANGNELKNVVNESVDLNSFSLGLRLGLEIFIF